MDNRITVPQVARLMGVTLDNKTSWSVGSEMAHTYQQDRAAHKACPHLRRIAWQDLRLAYTNPPHNQRL